MKKILLPLLCLLPLTGCNGLDSVQNWVTVSENQRVVIVVGIKDNTLSTTYDSIQYTDFKYAEYYDKVPCLAIKGKYFTNQSNINIVYKGNQLTYYIINYN